MATLRPFRAIRPRPETAAAVAAVPYDVVNREEALELARGNPLSFLHVSRPEIDLPGGTDTYSESVYAEALRQWQRIRREAPLLRDSEPRIYLYRLQRGSQIQTGIAATFSVREYDAGVIRRHEKTRRDKEDDRTRHVLTLEAQTGPAFLAFRGTSELKQLCEAATLSRPEFEFRAVDGVVHTLWAVREVAPWIKAFEKIPRLYIADGHHRTASASRAHATLSEGLAPELAGQAPHAFFLAVAFPAEELRILPYHRVIRSWGPVGSEGWLSAVEKDFVLTPDASAEPEKGCFSMYFERKWWGLKPRVPSLDRGIAGLDVSVLQDRVLSPLLGIGDPRTDKRIDFVGGVRGTQELETWVNEGRAVVAFSVHPTSLEDLFRISDADEIMPPKSTWFEPKLRDGIVSHSWGADVVDSR